MAGTFLNSDVNGLLPDMAGRSLARLRLPIFLTILFAIGFMTPSAVVAGDTALGDLGSGRIPAARIYPLLVLVTSACTNF